MQRRIVVSAGAAVVAAVVFALGSLAVVPSGSTASQKPAGRHGLAGLPAAAREAVARVLGRDEAQYQIRSLSGHRLTSRTQGVASAYSRAGVTISGRDGGSLQLGLAAIGRGAALAPLTSSAPTARGNQVTYVRPGAQEWYVNGPLGLEQGFSVSARPAGAGPLSLDVGSVRDSAAHVNTAGSQLSAAGLRYGDLTVTDAGGRSLAARIALSGTHIQLQVSDARARYPLHVDPLVQLAELTASDGATGDEAGDAVAMSADGNTIAVGSRYHTVDSTNLAGAVYVFTKPSGGSWSSSTEASELTLSSPFHNDYLGSSVAITPDGQTIVAGASGHLGNGQYQAGLVAVFTEPSTGGWAAATGPASHETAILMANDSTGFDQLGSGVAVSSDGSTIAAGSGGHNDTHGAVYVFTQPSSGGWAAASSPYPPTAELSASDLTDQARLGNAVAITGDGGLIAAGAEFQNNGSGAVYVFGEPDGGWGAATGSAADPAAELSDSASADDFLGASVAMTPDGQTIAGGASNGDYGEGYVDVFTQPSAGGWAAATGTAAHQSAHLVATDWTENDQLGSSVAVSSDGATIAAGAPGPVTTPPAPGAFYTFVEPAAGWATAPTPEPQNSEARGTDINSTGALGTAAALSADGGTATAGAPGMNSSTGGAFVFSAAPSALTGTTLSCLAGSQTTGLSTTCTATVTDISDNPTTPTGQVYVRLTKLRAYNESLSGSPCTLSGSGASASCSVTFSGRNAGAYPGALYAGYASDATHAASLSGAVAAPLGRATSTEVSCDSQQLGVGDSTTCTATVTDVAPGTPAAPAGKVSFAHTVLGSFSPARCTLSAQDASSSTCSVTFSAAKRGSRSIKASFSPKGVFRASSGTTTMTVS